MYFFYASNPTSTVALGREKKRNSAHRGNPTWKKRFNVTVTIVVLLEILLYNVDTVYTSGVDIFCSGVIFATFL